MPKIMTLRGALAALTCSMLFAMHARAEDPKRIEVPAGDLTAALEALTEQSGAELMYRTEQLKGLKTRGVSGRLSPKQAATRLLEGTSLKLRTDSSGAMLIGMLQPGGGLFGEHGYAQDGEPPAASGGAATAQPAGRQVETLDEVVVTARRATTATKTEALLIETPQSISVVTADQFIERGALLYEETLRYSAGIVAEGFGTDPRTAQTLARGHVTTMYQDGLRRSFGFSTPARFDVYTLERVEALRGPSSVLYGSGSAGGVINHVSKRPQFDRAVDMGVQYGSYDRQQFQFDATGALGDSDKFAARLVALTRDSDTQVDFIPDDRTLVMPSITWRPGEDTELTLIGTWSEDRLGLNLQWVPHAATLYAPPGRRLPDSFFGGEPGFDRFDIDERWAALFFDHRFSERLSFGSSVRYVDSHAELDFIFLDSFFDQDPSTPAVDPFIDAGSEIMPRYISGDDIRIDVLTIDNRLRFDVPSGSLSHSFLVGVDYQRFDQAGKAFFDVYAPLNIYNPVRGAAPQIVKEPASYLMQEAEQLGFYVQDQIDYADRVHVLLGARRDRASVRTASDPEQVDHATTYRAAVLAEVWEGVSPYISYAESFLPLAGVNSATQRTFVPIEGVMYEAGLKWAPAPRTLLTLAAFDVRERNTLTVHPTDPLASLQQGEVRSRGGEIEVSHRLFDGLDVTASYSYADAEVSESNNPEEIGAPLQATPEHQATLWAARSFDIGADAALRIGLGARYMGEHQSISRTLEIPDYTLVDALVGLDWKQWSLALNATNLLDERYYSTCLPRGDCFVGVRRYVVGTLGYRF